MNYLERGGERELIANAVILSAVEGSRHVTFKLSQRESLDFARDDDIMPADARRRRLSSAARP
jgi:hypothetical protein